MNIWEEIYSFFYTLFNQIIAAFGDFRILDIIDILVIALLIYKSIELLRETRAKQLVQGIIVVFFVWLFARWFDLVSLNWLLNKVLDYALIAVAIIFQPELRRALEGMGRSNFGKIIGLSSNSTQSEAQTKIEAICRAVTHMQEQRHGALIVMERKTQLGDIINTGTVLKAEISPDLISSIFYPKSPLHDGALIVRESKAYAAGCILPLTANTDLSNELGTRHRAALGMSENSDAVVIVVSEETGTVSLAIDGKITRDYNTLALKEELLNIFTDRNAKNQPAISIKKIFSKKGEANDEK